jgi:hypothetical protein
MFGELHREPPKRRTVHASEKTFDHAFGNDFDAAEARDFCRVEEI